MIKRTNTFEPPIPTPRQFASVAEIDVAIENLKRRLRQIESIDLGVVTYESPERETAESDIKNTILEVFGPRSSEYREHQYLQLWHGAQYVDMPEDYCQQCFADGLKHASGILRGLIASLEEKRRDVANAAAPSHHVSSGPSANRHVLDILQPVFDRFHVVARQLSHRHGGRSTLRVDDEYDVQDLLHALLRVFFEDIRREEWTPSYAGGAARMDFLLKSEETVVEVKMARSDLSARELGSQLIEDIARYQRHPDCKRIICFVYDPDGRVANPAGLERDLSRSANGLDVRVVIRPR